MSSSFALKEQHHLHQQQQHSSSSFSVQDILCSSLDDYYNATAPVSTSLPPADRTIHSVVKNSDLDQASGSSVKEELQVTEQCTSGNSGELIGSTGLQGDCNRNQYNGHIAAAAAFYAGSNVALYGSMSSGSGTAGGGACSPHHHTLHHHNHHHPHHHPAAAAAAAAAFASQYAGGPAELGHYSGSGGTAGFTADSMPVRGCVGGPWYAPSPAPDPRLTSKSNQLEQNYIGLKKLWP